jgi:hypothetical protein
VATTSKVRNNTFQKRLSKVDEDKQLEAATNNGSGQQMGLGVQKAASLGRVGRFMSWYARGSPESAVEDYLETVENAAKPFLDLP